MNCICELQLFTTQSVKDPLANEKSLPSEYKFSNLTLIKSTPEVEKYPALLPFAATGSE